MRAFALAAAACLTVGQADAAIYKFDFEWTQRSWDPNINDDTVNGGYFRRSGGSLIINEALYPGRSIANTTLRFTANYWPQVAEVSVAGSSTYDAFTTDDDGQTILHEIGLIFSGAWPVGYPVTMQNSIEISFDSVGQIVSFSGSEAIGIARQSGRDARVNLDEILRRGVREGIILIVAGKMLARC